MNTQPRTKLAAVPTETPPASLYAKIISVAVAMEPLTKRDHNPEEGYAFVSIDDYYATAAKALLNAGVSWICREDGYRDEGRQCSWRFAFDLFDAEGNVWNEAGKVTVPHDFDGPQTAGKVVSYAEKIFLRQLLKLVTGEPDADVSSRRRSVRVHKVDEVISHPSHGATFSNDSAHELTCEDLITAIEVSSTELELNALIDKNKRLINRMNRDDPDVFTKIANARTKKLAQFTGANDDV